VPSDAPHFWSAIGKPKRQAKPREPARVLELALPPAASSDYSLDLGCSQYRASGPSLPPDGLWLQRLVLRLAAPPVVLLVH
jgi:hypothetical protein